MMIYPEDSGSQTLSGRSSPWCLKAFSILNGLTEAKRGAGFSCLMATADQQLPLGMFSHFTSSQKDMCVDWPQLSRAEGVLSHIGPPLGPCPCEGPHSNSSEVVSLGFGFWRRCFASLGVQIEPVSVADGNCAGPGSSFFLSSEPDSWHQLYSNWSTGVLTRTFPSFYSSTESVDSYLSPSGTLDAGPFQISA